MITVINQEHQNKIEEAEDVLKVRSWAVLQQLELGVPISNLHQSLMITCCHLDALKNYETGEFQPEVFFNVLSSDGETAIYSGINTIK